METLPELVSLRYFKRQKEQNRDIPQSRTVKVRLPHQTKSQLAELATRTRRASSFLAAQAITTYVRHEFAAIKGIERGLADAAAGRVIPHDEVMRQAHELIKNIRAKA